jgi:hypothetical protein
MATSLWLCRNRQSIIPNRGATRSCSFSNIAEQRKRPTEQMKKAVAELLGEEFVSLAGAKLSLRSSPRATRRSHSPFPSFADFATALSTASSIPYQSDPATVAPSAGRRQPIDTALQTLHGTCATRSCLGRASPVLQLLSGSRGSPASDCIPRWGVRGCKSCPTSPSTPSNSLPALKGWESRALCRPSESIPGRACG